MDEYLKAALEIVKAQARVRNMTETEITSMVNVIAEELRKMAGAEEQVEPEKPVMDPKKAIRERSVVCLECGQSFKILTKKHLATHGLTPEEYKEKWGYKKGTKLVARVLSRARKKKMNEMKLWEKRALKFH